LLLVALVIPGFSSKLQTPSKTVQRFGTILKLPEYSYYLLEINYNASKDAYGKTLLT
jgi:hypothetical protein